MAPAPTPFPHPPHPLQAVRSTAQQLLRGLLAQEQRVTRVCCALGLLLHCPAAIGNREHLIRRTLLPLLTPRDLSSDELTLPLLQALDQCAVAGAWAASGSADSSGDGAALCHNAGRAAADAGLACAVAQLLASCVPSARALDALHRTLQVTRVAVSCNTPSLCVSSNTPSLCAAAPHITCTYTHMRTAIRAAAPTALLSPPLLHPCWPHTRHSHLACKGPPAHTRPGL